MDLATARREAVTLFTDLGPPAQCKLIEFGRREGQGQGFFEQLGAMTPPGFPIPELLLFGLTELLQLYDHGPEEKVRWSVGFSVRGATFYFEYRKFGLRFLVEPRNLSEAITREVLGKARALTDMVEKYVADSDFATEQIKAGSFTAQNLYSRLDERYRFLREQARLAYETPPPPPETEVTEHGTHYSHDTMKPTREGGALGGAAVDAYFSRTEHLFCLVAGFADLPLPQQDFPTFLAANWPTKARAILDLQEATAKNFYDRLVEVREEWRNPLAHGGFLSKGGSLYFHLPGIGALPARLRRTPTGARVRFMMHDSSFSELMAFFDSFDEYLRAGALKYAVRWVEDEMNVAFDAHSRREYAAAAQSEQAFNNLVERTHYLLDRHANMDY